MNTKLWRGWAAASAVVVGTLMPATAAWAQVQSVEASTPRIPEESLPSAALTWAIAFCFTLLILLVAFKNSRRTHLD
jgi:hypothetical protein